MSLVALRLMTRVEDLERQLQHRRQSIVHRGWDERWSTSGCSGVEGSEGCGESFIEGHSKLKKEELHANNYIWI